mmetsp:Transcript_21833/g.64412  ORF Transcript_21833/g.64412 Transcript_21833/m.64412 type:complete len:328 (-) Transcript_21833:970-1953(-)
MIARGGGFSLNSAYCTTAVFLRTLDCITVAYRSNASRRRDSRYSNAPERKNTLVLPATKAAAAAALGSASAAASASRSRSGRRRYSSRASASLLRRESASSSSSSLSRPTALKSFASRESLAPNPEEEPETIPSAIVAVASLDVADNDDDDDDPMFLPLRKSRSARNQNLPRTSSKVRRFGKVERDTVTADTSPAHRSWAHVWGRSTTPGVASRFGLMHLTYLVLVRRTSSARDPNCVRNLVHTESPINAPFRLRRRPIAAAALPEEEEEEEKEENSPPLSAFFHSSIPPRMRPFALLNPRHSATSSGRVSTFFATKEEASYVTGPA